MHQPFSLVIITKNAAGQLADCIRSVPGAAEVVVVDSGSDDGTPEIAASLGARVLHQDWLGYGPQKRFATLQASHDWVLSLDADERLTPELHENILRVLATPQAAAYALPRCNRFMGRWLRHGEGYPDWCVRLYDRRRANWSDDLVHEKLIAHGPVEKLSGDLLHESEQGLARYLEKQNDYSDIQAIKLFNTGKKTSTIKMFFSPVFRFFKFYIFRLGILDGKAGLVHIAIGSFTSFLKYAKLAEMTRQSRNRIQ